MSKLNGPLFSAAAFRSAAYSVEPTIGLAASQSGVATSASTRDTVNELLSATRFRCEEYGTVCIAGYSSLITGNTVVENSWFAVSQLVLLKSS